MTKGINKFFIGELPFQQLKGQNNNRFLDNPKATTMSKSFLNKKSIHLNVKYFELTAKHIAKRKNRFKKTRKIRKFNIKNILISSWEKIEVFGDISFKN